MPLVLTSSCGIPTSFSSLSPIQRSGGVGV